VPAVITVLESKEFDGNTTALNTHYAVFDVRRFASCSVQLGTVVGSYNTGAVTIQRSNDGINWFSLPFSLVLFAPGIYDVDTSTFAYLRVVTTTVNGSAYTWRVTLCGKADESDTTRPQVLARGLGA
jgi:hypothetical protein